MPTRNFDDDTVDIPADWVEQAIDADQFMASVARFMLEGDERDEARILLTCELYAWDEQDDFGNEVLVLRFSGPRRAYDALSDRTSSAYRALEHAADALRPGRYQHVWIQASAATIESPPADWRNEMLAVLDGKAVDNQAVGFKATKSWNGLRFRSESEVRIAEALDRAHVAFLPNCRGRYGGRDETRRNVEADFIVLDGGKWGVLEVDGSKWHGNAARDHQRDRPLKWHGAAIVERFDAGECFENPDGVVKQFLALLRAKG